MDERSTKIASGLTDAKKHKELLSETESEYKRFIAEARKDHKFLCQKRRKMQKNLVRI